MILTSANGSAWALQTQVPNVHVPLAGVIYGGGQFVVVGNSGTILTSFDGVTWVAQFSGSTGALFGVTYGNGQFVIAGATFGKCLIITSSNGSSWTAKSWIPTNNLHGISYGNSGFVAVGDNGTILFSPDGMSWAIQSFASGNLKGVTYDNGCFISVGENSGGDGTIVASPNGSSWTEITESIVFPLYAITYGNNIFVTVGEVGIYLTSPDGSNWTSTWDPRSDFSNLNGVAYGNGRFVAVSGDTTLSSFNGSLWAIHSSVSTKNLNGVAYGEGRFVAVGDSGAILTSPDDSIWTACSSGTTKALYGATYDSNQFVVVGENGTILTSHDCSVWASQTSGTTNDLNGVSYGNGLFVATGAGGTILISKTAFFGTVLKSSINKAYTSEIRIKIANGHISVILPYVVPSSQVKVRIFTMAGERIYSATRQTNNGTLNIPIPRLSTGTYLMSITGSKGVLRSFFVVTK
jgi:hypothetical protein